MEILSRAWRSDLALLAASGSEIEDHGTCIVVRTPENPGFVWGNFLLLRRAPLRRDLPAWEQVFDEALPGTEHRAFGIDDPDGSVDDLTVFAARGYEVEVTRAMTATDLTAPRRLDVEIAIRQLKTDQDWAARIALSRAVDEATYGPGFVEFLVRKVAAERAMAESGAGDWFGAFAGDTMVSGLGIFATGHGPARFQDVLTRPDWRGRGLASAMVVHAGRYALDALGADSLVIVVDPGNPAYRLYQAVGFTAVETQLQATLREG